MLAIKRNIMQKILVCDWNCLFFFLIITFAGFYYYFHYSAFSIMPIGYAGSFILQRKDPRPVRGRGEGAGVRGLYQFNSCQKILSGGEQIQIAH